MRVPGLRANAALEAELDFEANLLSDDLPVNALLDHSSCDRKVFLRNDAGNATHPPVRFGLVLCAGLLRDATEHLQSDEPPKHPLRLHQPVVISCITTSDL